jgi:hypothetical protein
LGVIEHTAGFFELMKVSACDEFEAADLYDQVRGIETRN